MLLGTGKCVIDAIAAPSKTTALILAAQNAHHDVMTALIEAKANVNASNMYGNTPLHESARALDIDGVNMLLRSGAKIAGNKKQSTPLHFVCYEEKNAKLSVEVAELLLNAAEAMQGGQGLRELVNTRDYRGLTPLLVCCTTGNTALLKLLRSKGGDVNAVDAEGRTATKIAEFYGKKKMVELLTETDRLKPNERACGKSPAQATTSGVTGRDKGPRAANTGSIRTSKSAHSSRQEAGGAAAVPKVPLKPRPQGVSGRTKKAPTPGVTSKR